jgi:AraC-like DNA-binding protein
MIYRREKSLPLARVVLIVNLGEPVRVSGSGQGDSGSAWDGSWCIGPWSRYHFVEWPSHVHQIGIEFKTAGAYPFLQLPVSELYNRYVSLDDIWGQCASELRERLYAASTIQSRFMLLEQFLLSRLGEESRRLKTVEYGVRKIADQHGVLSIQKLSEQMGIFQNHLGTYFKQMIGLSPKTLAKHFQLRRVLRSINPAQPVDWVHMALQSGYYDQPHLNRDFVNFFGHSPTNYLRLLRQKQADDPQYQQFGRLLPVD